MFKPLNEKEELIGRNIIDIAINVHKYLGAGLLESVYEKCFCYELSKRNLPFLKQHPVPIIYDDVIIDEGLRIDILVDQLVIVELKANENYHPVWESQLLSYMKLSRKRLGYIINFHVPLMKLGIKRMIL